jgi:hypothetical protein
MTDAKTMPGSIRAMAEGDDSAGQLPAGAKFPLGRVTVTPSATEWLPAEVIARSLARHQSGDWGHVSEAFAGEMDEALRRGWPVMSVYFRWGPSFLIFTTGDRTETRISMPWDSRI